MAQTDRPDAFALQLFKRADKMKTKRMSIYDPQWQQISQYVWPDVSDINTDKTESTQDWFDRIYTQAPVRASRTCSVGVRNWVTPSTEPWLSLAPPYNLTKGGQATATNPRLARLSSPQAPAVDENGMDEATRWCGDVASQILNWLSESNFYSIIQPFNRSACSFGTALMFMGEGKTTTFNFEQFKIGTYCIAENEEKIVDTVVRWFKLTVRQAEQRFGKGNLPEKMRKDIEANRFDEQYTFLHHVMPMEDFKAMGGEMDTESMEEQLAGQMAYASVYQAELDKVIVQTRGYEEMPYFCLRWSRWGTENEVWGCSPGFETLADSRELNGIVQFTHAIVEQKAFPRVFVPDSLDGNVEMAAGSATVLKADDMARGVKPEEWMTKGELPDVYQLMEALRKDIDGAFFVDVFTALSQLDDKITESTYGAIALLQGEKLDQFTGTFDQYRTELINLLVRRAIGISYRAGLLKDPPASLMVRPGNDPKAEPQLAAPKIQIKSRVTVALGQYKNQGLQKQIETWAPLMEGHPELWDNVNGDESFRRSGMDNGMPAGDFRPLRQVAALRDQRAKMQQREQALHAAEIAGKAAGGLGKAPPGIQKQVTDSLETAGGGQQAA